MAHFPSSVSIFPLLPSPSLSSAFSSHSHLLISLSPNSLLLFLLLSFPASSLLPSLISHLFLVASCFVTLSSSTWLCRQENQTLSELQQGKPNADRAWKLAMLFVVGEARGVGGFREMKCSQSSWLCWEAYPPCCDKLLAVNALKNGHEMYGKYQDTY